MQFGQIDGCQRCIKGKRLRDTILTMLRVVFTFAALNYKTPNYVNGRKKYEKMYTSEIFGENMIRFYQSLFATL